MHASMALATPFVPFFILSMVLTAAGLLPLWRIRDEGAIPAGQVSARLSRTYPALAAAVRRRAAAGRKGPRSGSDQYRVTEKGE